MNANDVSLISKRLDALTRAEKSQAWIRSDLELTPSTFLGRMVWKVTKYIPFARSLFYGVDLEASKSNLLAIRSTISKLPQNAQLVDLFNRAVRTFNSIAPNHLVESLQMQALISTLNQPDPSFDLIMANLSQESANLRLFAVEPQASGGKKQYQMASKVQAEKSGCPIGTQSYSNSYNHTTTLTNIVATNECHFTHQQVEQLIDRLIELKVDFSAVDYTSFQGQWAFYPSIQNNPLKSLIALGSGTNEHDAVLKRLIQYIGSLPEEKKQEIFEHRDNFPLGNMRPLYFLIRQGKEDIAIELVRQGSKVTEEDLLLACHSFGTSALERPRGVLCVEVLYRAHRSILSPQTRDACKAALQKASKDAVTQHLPRLRKIVQAWAEQKSEGLEEKMSQRVRERLGISFNEFIRRLKDTNEIDRATYAYAELIELNHDIGHGLFGDMYRVKNNTQAEPKLAELKYKYVTTLDGEKKLKELIAFFS